MSIMFQKDYTMHANREDYNAYMRKYFAKGTEAYEKQLVRTERWRQNNKEKVAEKMRKYMAKGTEAYDKQLERNREWREKNKEKERARIKAYRAKKRAEANASA